MRALIRERLCAGRSPAAATAVVALRTAFASLPPEDAWKVTRNWLTIDAGGRIFRKRQSGGCRRIYLRDCFAGTWTYLAEIAVADYETLAELSQEFHALQRAAQLAEVQGELLKRTREARALLRKPPQRFRKALKRSFAGRAALR
jgi:hypothetical protein